MATRQKTRNTKKRSSSSSKPKKRAAVDRRQVGAADSQPMPIAIPGVSRFILFAVLSVLFLWSYWPYLVQIVGQWNSEPDYSHGFLVVPLALFFLWSKMDSAPEWSSQFSVLGLLVVLMSVGIRLLGSLYYIDALVGWSIPVWWLGATFMTFGLKSTIWALPGIAFLFFMIPFPYILENLLSQPLQSASTSISNFALQSVYLPAMSEGNTILLGEHRLEVARACSGVRIFLGIFALAYAFCIFAQRSWFIRLLLLASAFPIALLVNSGRIFSTGLLYHFGFKENYGHLVHDLAGFFMIPIASFLFFAFLAYLDRLFPSLESMSLQEVMEFSSD